MNDPIPVAPLNYQQPEAGKRPPSSIRAMLLCLPGLICWCALIENLFRWWLPTIGIGRFLMGFPLLILWPTAITTAIASIVTYRRTRKPWYVVLNLVINISGLLISIVLIGLIGYVIFNGFGFE